MKIRTFEKEDVRSILAIQDKSPQAARWVEFDYTRLAKDPYGLILVAESDSLDRAPILGFAACSIVVDEAELRNIAVDPSYQRRGIGRALVVDAFGRLVKRGAKRIFLEVRASNLPAQELYFSLGFSLSSIRKHYYQNPSEDAWVLFRSLPELRQ